MTPDPTQNQPGHGDKDISRKCWSKPRVSEIPLADTTFRGGPSNASPTPAPPS